MEKNQDTELRIKFIKELLLLNERQLDEFLKEARKQGLLQKYEDGQ